MVKDLITRYKFSVLAGVSAAAITKACRNSLAPAMDGKRIDANHPAAKKYLDNQIMPVPKIGVDNLYEDAVKCCQSSKNYSGKFLRGVFGIGSERAKRIVETMRLNGVIPEKIQKKPHTNEKRPPVHVEIQAVRGRAKIKADRKQEGILKIYEIPEDIEEFAEWTLKDLIKNFGTDIRFCDWLTATKTIEAINEKRLKNAATRGDLVSRVLVENVVFSEINMCHRRLLSDGARSLSINVKAMVDSEEGVEEIEKYIHDQIGSFIKPMKNKVSRALREMKKVKEV